MPPAGITKADYRIHAHCSSKAYRLNIPSTGSALSDFRDLIRDLNGINHTIACRATKRTAPVRIYELIGKPGEVELPLLDIFAEGLTEYKNRQWERAERHFRSIASMDRPSRTYLERCILFRTDPPPENWDGVFVHKVK